MGTFPAPRRTALDDRNSDEEEAKHSKWFYKNLLWNFQRTWEPEEKQQRIKFSLNNTYSHSFDYLTESEENTQRIISRANQKLAIDGWRITDWAIEHDLEYVETRETKEKVNVVLSTHSSVAKVLVKALRQSKPGHFLTHTEEFPDGTKICIEDGITRLVGVNETKSHHHFKSKNKKVENKSCKPLSKVLAAEETPFFQNGKPNFDERLRLLIYMEYSG